MHGETVKIEVFPLNITQLFMFTGTTKNSSNEVECGRDKDGPI
jgi:hypothetical protein